jgi:hypothetical protein
MGSSTGYRGCHSSRRVPQPDKRPRVAVIGIRARHFGSLLPTGPKLLTGNLFLPRTPRLVRQDVERLVLVEGLHRLEECKQLGEEAIVGYIVQAHRLNGVRRGARWRRAVLTANMLDYNEGTANFAFVEPEREYGPAPFGRFNACTIC